MPKASGLRSGTRAVVLTAIVGLGLSGAVAASAIPPPPPNPSDSQLHHSRNTAQEKAAAVGRLTSKVAAAEDKLRSLSDQVEVKKELANKALVDLQDAQDAARQAEDAAHAAQQQVQAAQQRIDDARKKMDAFAAGSYEQGNMIGSASAFLGAKSPDDVLARQQLLDAISGSKLDALDAMRRARTVKANKDSAARAALAEAKQKKAAAADARSRAAAAKRTAIDAQQGQQDQTASLKAHAADLKDQLQAARAKVGNLETQRANYNDWLQRKKAAEAAAARRAAQEAAARQAAASQPPSSGGGSSGSGGGGTTAPPPSSSSGSVAAVIARARSVLGMPYAWGGGNYYGPTRGIHDGGVADSYGDYNKIGFDCSGLMMYAFAAAGVHLRHFTGYQYNAGRHVPLSQMQPGDMIFYHTGSFIHHVTLYIGNGMMIEAPESGSVVQISPVRYGGIMPYVTRVL